MKRYLSSVGCVLVFFLLVGTGLAQTASTRVSASLSSATCPGSGCLAFAVSGFGGVGIQVVGTFTGTISFEGTVDDSTWVALNMTPPGSTTAVTTTTAVGAWIGAAGGLSQVRARFSSYTSGTANVTMVSAPTTARGGGGGSSVVIAEGEVAYACSANTLCGDADFVWDESNRILKLGAVVDGTVTIQANAAGEQLHLYAATGTGGSGTGGQLVLVAGDGGAGGGSGGDVSLSSGAANGAGDSGAIFIQTGLAGGGGSSGVIEIFAGLVGLTVTPTGVNFTGPLSARYVSSGATPAVADTSANSCGTGTETIVGNDNASKVTVIGSAGTSCTVTFATAFANAPSCFVTNETTANLARATSTASTVIVAGTFLQNDVLAIGCIGR